MRGAAWIPAGSLTRQHGCCNRRLTVAEASVAGAHLTVLEDFEVFLLEPFTQQAREAAIVHASAGERNLIDAGC
jgi:hypothetical protein